MVGVPYDSVPVEALPPADHIGPTPPPALRRHFPQAPAGAWSDGGSQVLALIDSLASQGRLDLDDLAERLMSWLARGDYCVSGVVFEYGVQTTRALAAYRDGVPAADCGPRGEHRNGNGALMRVLPIALWWQGDDAGLVALARHSCLPTHGHALSQLCAALYCLWVRRSLDGQANAWEHSITTLRELLTDPDDQHWLDRILEAEHLPHPNNRYVVNTLWSVVDAHRAGSTWLERVRAAIRLGNDTDTAAALVGGVSAAQDGLAQIPAEWIEVLPAEPCLHEALAAVARFSANNSTAG